MASNQKEYRILINGIEESFKNVESLGKALDELDKKVKSVNSGGGASASVGDPSQTEALARATEKLAQAQSASAQELAALKLATQDANREAKLQAQLANAAEGSYNQLSAQYSLTKMQLNAMSEEERHGTEEGRKLEQTAKDLHDRMKELQESTGNASLNVGNYTESINKAEISQVNLKSEIKRMTAEMAEMQVNGQKNSEEYVELARKAGEYKDALSDANDEIKHFASDTQGLDNVINIATTGIDVFQTYQGVMAMCGEDTSEYEETMQELAGAMSTLNGIQGIYNTLQDKSTAIGGAYQKIVKLITTQTKAATVAQEGMTTAQKVGAVASRTLSVAMKAIPLMFIIGLVAELVLHWQDIWKWLTKTFPVLNKLGGAFGTFKGILMGVGEAIIHWVTNPLKTMAAVIKKVLAGDFSGAVQEAIDGVKNQFTGIGKAFQQGFNQQIADEHEKGQEKIRQQRLKAGQDALKDMEAQGKQNTKAYRKQLEANLKLQKKGTEEYKEAQRALWQWDTNQRERAERQKTNTTKTGVSNRLKIRKAGYSASLKAEEEYRKKQEELAKNEADIQKKALEDIQKQQRQYLKDENDLAQEQTKIEIDKYKTGPIEKYTDALEKLEKLRNNASSANTGNTIADYFQNAQELFAKVKKNFGDLVKLFNEVTAPFINDENKNGLFWRVLFGKEGTEDEQINEAVKKFKGYTQEELTLLAAYVSETSLLQKEAENEAIKNQRDTLSETAKGYKSTIDHTEKVFDDHLKNVKDKAKKVQPVYNKVWGFFDKKETEEAYEPVRKAFDDVVKESHDAYSSLVSHWDEYVKTMKDLYGEDSNAYKDALADRKKAFQKFLDEMEEAMAGADPSASPSPKQKELWDKSGSTIGNISDILKDANEMLFQPMADTLSMYWDMVIDEIQDKLDTIQDLYDDMTEKVQDSEEKISEIQDKMKNGSKADTEALKEQLADEQLLYAQRAAKQKQLDNEKQALEAKQKKAEKAQRKNDMRANIAMAIANTAMGATKTLSEWSYPLGIIFAAIQTAFGLAQVAIMTAQLSKMAEGGIIKAANGTLINDGRSGGVAVGRSHAQGGIPVVGRPYEIEGGEAIINKKSTAKYLDLLSAINQAEGGRKLTADAQMRKFATGGVMNYQKIDDDMRANNQQSAIANAISNIDFQPYVRVVDYEKASGNLVRVRQLAGSNK